MERAEIGERFALDGFEDIECGIIKWPMSVIRIRGERSARLVELAVHILEAWRGYTDESATMDRGIMPGSAIGKAAITQISTP